MDARFFFSLFRQGGIDDGEDPRHAVMRELREETGVSSAEIVAEVGNWGLSPAIP